MSSDLKLKPLAEWLEKHLVTRVRHDIKATYFAAYVGKNGERRKQGYKPVKTPISLDDLNKHLGGSTPLGCYVMDPAADGTVLSAVVDLDDKEKLLSWSELCAQGRAVVRELEQRGLLPLVVRSGSGHGLHLWLLWREPQPANVVRHHLKAAVEAAALSCHVDIYPAQDTLGGGLGNLVALPFSRESRPVRLLDELVYADLTGWPLLEPALSRPLGVSSKSVKSGKGTASRAATHPQPGEQVLLSGDSELTVEELAADSGKGLQTIDTGALGPLSPELLKSALDKLSCEDYHHWVRVGLALKVAAHRGELDEEVALKLWDDWSAADSEKYEVDACLKKWLTFRPREAGGVTVGSIFHAAKEAGWVMPPGGVVPPAPVELGELLPTVRETHATREVESLTSFVEIDRSTDPLLKKEMAWLRGGGGNDIDEMNKDHFIARDGGKVHLFVEEEDDRLKRKILTKMSVQDFKVMYQNQQVLAGMKGRTPVYKPLGDFWLESPFRRQYRQIVLEPGEKACKPWQYNLWQGWSVQPSESGSWDLLDRHILDNICRGDPIAHDYLLNWMAFTIQNPSRPIGTAVVLRGNKGTGKSLFVRAFGELFAKHFTQVTNSKQVTGNFNAHLRSCIMLFADEAVWAGSRTEESTLKAYITEPYLQIEGKGQNVVTCPNMLHVVIATNHMWSAPASMDERRFFCLNVGDGQQGNPPYFKAILRQLGAGGDARLLYDMLRRDLSKFDPLKVPQTDELTEQKLNSMAVDGKWWYHRLQEGTLHKQAEKWETHIPAAQIYQDYVDFCRDMGERNYLGAPEILSKLLEAYTDQKIRRGRRKAKLEGDVRSRPYTIWTLPPLHECRNAFQKKIGKIRWTVWHEEDVEAAFQAHESSRDDDTLDF